MPHLTGNLSVNDGQTTPVARTFELRKVDQALLSTAYKRVSTDPKKFWILGDVVWSDSSKNRPTVRQATTITYPIKRNNAVTGVEEVVATARADISFVIPDEMTEAEAEDLHAFVRNLSNNTSIKVGVTKREPIFA